MVKGQVMGTITLQSGDTVYGTVDLLADEDVAVSRLLVFRRDLLDFLHKPTLWIVLGASGAVIILLVILRAIYIGDPVREVEPEDIPRSCRLLYGTAFLSLALCALARLAAGGLMQI